MRWVLHCWVEPSVISVSSSPPLSPLLSPPVPATFSLPSHRSPLCHSHFELQLRTHSLSTRGLLARPAWTKGEAVALSMTMAPGSAVRRTLHRGPAEKLNCALRFKVYQRNLIFTGWPLLTFERPGLHLLNSFNLKSLFLYSFCTNMSWSILKIDQGLEVIFASGLMTFSFCWKINWRLNWTPSASQTSENERDESFTHCHRVIWAAQNLFLSVWPCSLYEWQIQLSCKIETCMPVENKTKNMQPC